CLFNQKSKSITAVDVTFRFLRISFNWLDVVINHDVISLTKSDQILILAVCIYHITNGEK
ncbi:MAG: hypothetical protein RLZZ382_251, partial [Bacteroidota bacterium]